MMLSRVAEALYWLGRYVERAENTARLVSVNSFLLLDLPPGVRPEWKPLIDITGGNEAFEQGNDSYDERAVVRFLLGDRRNGGSVLGSVEAARSHARTIRDAIPRGLWEVLNELHLFAGEGLKAGLGVRGRDRYLRQIMRGAQTFSGVVNDVMRHDLGYHFLRLGRLVERADMTTRILDVRTFDLVPPDTLGAIKPTETLQWVSILQSLSAHQTYRRSVQPRISRSAVLEFVLLDEDFARSYYYCVTRAAGVLEQLPRAEPAQREAGRVLRSLRTGDTASLARDPDALHTFIDQLQVDVRDLHTAIHDTYFGHGGAERPEGDSTA